MGNDDVNAAFELILEAIEGVRAQITRDTTQAMDEDRHDDAERHVASGKQLKDFRSKLEQLQQEWVSAVNPETRTRVRITMASPRGPLGPIEKKVPPPSPTASPVPKTIAHATKAPATGLRVTFPDGRVIHRPKAADTFADTIEELGLEKVRALGLVVCKVPLVGSLWAGGTYPAQHKRGPYYIVTHSSTEQKRSLLKVIARKLKTGLQIEIV